MQLINNIRMAYADKDIRTNIFLVAFLPYLILGELRTASFGSMIPNAVFSLLGIWVILISFFSIMTDHLSPAQFLVELFLGVAFFLSYRNSQNITIFIAYLMVIDAHQVDFDRIVKMTLYVSATITGALFIASLIHLIPNLAFYRGSQVRYSFGIVYPTDFAARIFYLLAMYLYVRNWHLKWLEIAVLTGAILFVWKFTDARLDAMLMFICMLAAMLFKLSVSVQSNRGINKIARRCSVILSYIFAAMVSIGAVLSVVFSALFGKFTFLDKINSLLSGRLSLGNTALDYYHVKPFGQTIEMRGWGGLKMDQINVDQYHYFMIDSAYVQLFILYGLITFVTVILVYSIFEFSEIKRGNYLVVMLFGVVLLSAMVDQHLIQPAYNIFMIIPLAKFSRHSYLKKLQGGDQLEKA